MSSQLASREDTVKLLRAALEQLFPDVEFEVLVPKTSSSIIHVIWTDGPSRNAVERFAGRYEVTRIYTDPIDRIPAVTDTLENGDLLYYCVEYIFYWRKHTRDFMEKLASFVLETYPDACDWNLRVYGSPDGAYISHSPKESDLQRVADIVGHLMDQVDAYNCEPAFDYHSTKSL